LLGTTVYQKVRQEADNGNAETGKVAKLEGLPSGRVV